MPVRAPPGAPSLRTMASQDVPGAPPLKRPRFSADPVPRDAAEYHPRGAPLTHSLLWCVELLPMLPPPAMGSDESSPAPRDPTTDATPGD